MTTTLAIAGGQVNWRELQEMSPNDFGQLALSFTGELSDEARSRRAHQLLGELELAIKSAKNPAAIRACTAESIVDCMIQAARCGLSLNPSASHAYLIPYKNVCTLQISYRGFIHLFYQCGIKSIQADLVYSGEDCPIRLGTDGYVHHTPNPDLPRNWNTLKFGWGEAVLPSGERIVWMVDKAYLERIRASSRAKNNGPWQTWPEAMAKKSVIRQGEKMLPQMGDLHNIEALRNAFQHDNKEYDLEAFQAREMSRRKQLAAQADAILEGEVVAPDDDHEPTPTDSADMKAFGAKLAERVHNKLVLEKSQWIDNGKSGGQFVTAIFSQLYPDAERVTDIEQLKAVETQLFTTGNIAWDTAEIVPDDTEI